MLTRIVEALRALRDHGPATDAQLGERLRDWLPDADTPPRREAAARRLTVLLVDRGLADASKDRYGRRVLRATVEGRELVETFDAVGSGGSPDAPGGMAAP